MSRGARPIADEPVSTEFALEIHDLRHRWPNADTDLLQIQNLNISYGEHVLLQGASGSGKSTLLNLVAGTLKPSAGNITVAGQNLRQISGARCDKLRAERMGIIFQQFNLLPYLSPLENIVLPVRLLGKGGEAFSAIKYKAERLMDRLGLSGIDNISAAGQLSIGQQQRVAAARALIGAPALIIADEPTSALDDISRDAFLTVLIEEAKQANAAILFVSHDTRIESYFERVLHMSQFRPQ